MQPEELQSQLEAVGYEVPLIVIRTWAVHVQRKRVEVFLRRLKRKYTVAHPPEFLLPFHRSVRRAPTSEKLLPPSMRSTG